MNKKGWIGDSNKYKEIPPLASVTAYKLDLKIM